MTNQPTYFTTQGAAEFLSIGGSTLEKLRLTGGGPRYCKPLGRRVLYDLDDLRAWLDASKRRSTSERPTEAPSS